MKKVLIICLVAGILIFQVQAVAYAFKLGFWCITEGGSATECSIAGQLEVEITQSSLGSASAAIKV